MLRRALSGMIFCVAMSIVAAHAGQFLEAPQYATGANPQAVAIGDFNRDGKLDIVVANAGTTGGNSISVLLGNGDGTFQAQAVYLTDTAPEGVAVGDFNGDGYLDIAVTNSGSNTVSIFLNKADGSGAFGSRIDSSTGNQPQGLAVGDFNEDGQLDVAVTNAADGTVGVLLGKGNGAFSAQVAYNTGFNPRSIAVGQIYNSGHLDLAIANDNNSHVVSVLKGNGDGTFQGQIQSNVVGIPVWIALADFNGDGNLDIVVAEQFDPVSKLGNSISVLLGNGKGSFSPHVEYTTGAFPTAVAVGDFNGDGFLDLAVSDSNGNSASVFSGRGDGTFYGQLNVGTGDIPYSAVAGDFNGDGNADIVVANSGGASISVILSNGKNDTFQARTDYLAGTDARTVATGDFNGDGFLDLAVANRNCPKTCNPGTVSIVLGNGDGTFQGPNYFSTDTATELDTDPHFVTVGDFNGDGKPDLAVADYGTNTVSVLLGLGDGTFGPAAAFAVGSEPTSLATGDFNGDGKLDLAVTNFNSNTVSILLGNGDGTFQPTVTRTYAVGNGPISVAVSDFNRDGKLDLVVVNETDNNAGVLLGNGDGTFKPQVVYLTGDGGNPLSIVVGDFNGDGFADLALADFQTEQVSVLLGKGDGTFQPFKPYPTGANPSSIVAADFNGDGKLDLAVTSTPLGSSAGNVVSLLLGNGDGTFGTHPTLFGAGYLSYSAVVGDFNGDGAADLAVANGGSNTVSLLLNVQGTAISFTSSGSPSEYGTSVKLTVSVAESVSNGSAPTGTVTIMNGSTVIGSGNLASGPVSVSTSSLPVGSNALSAVYSGDKNYQKHTVFLTQTVTQAGSSVALGSSANPSSPNQLVTFTAAVSSKTSGLPTGTVTFLDGVTALGHSSIDGNGNASFSTSSLAIGTHNVTAAYGGDSNFTASNSVALGQVVSLTPAFAISASALTPPSLLAGANSTSTITITAAGGLDPSTVKLSCSSILPASNTSPTCSFSSITVANGVGTATLTVSTTGPSASLNERRTTLFYAIAFLLPTAGLGLVLLPKRNSEKFVAMALVLLISGGCIIQSACGGGSKSTSTTPTPTVKSVSSTALASSANPTLAAQVVTFSASVTSSSGAPTGSVSFFDGSTNLGSGNLTSGVASFQSSSLAAGTHSITASYGGDAKFNGSTSTALSQVVDNSGTASGTYTITVSGSATGATAQTAAPLTLVVQ